MNVINKDIKNDFEKINQEIEILSASQFIINKRNKLKNSINNAEGIKNDFKYNFNICVELLINIKNNKNKYLSCLNNISSFIENINNLTIKTRKNNDNKINNILIYKEEKETIKKIEECLKAFEDLLRKNIYKSLLNTPYEYLLKDKDIEKDLFFIND